MSENKILSLIFYTVLVLDLFEFKQETLLGQTYGINLTSTLSICLATLIPRITSASRHHHHPLRKMHNPPLISLNTISMLVHCTHRNIYVRSMEIKTKYKFEQHTHVPSALNWSDFLIWNFWMKKAWKKKPIIMSHMLPSVLIIRFTVLTLLQVDAYELNLFQFIYTLYWIKLASNVGVCGLISFPFPFFCARKQKLRKCIRNWMFMKLFL